MDSTLLYYAIGIIVLGALTWYTRSKSPDSVYDVFEQYQAAIELAPQVVAAVEQLWLTGEIGKDDRLQEGVERLGQLVPALDPKTLRMFIEAAVWMAKQGVLAIELDGGDDDGGKPKPLFERSWN